MSDCYDTCAPATLIEIRPSRWLLAWRASLALVVAAAMFMVSPPLGILVLLIELWRGLRRAPDRRSLLIVSAGARFAMPGEGRFDLALAPGSREGPGWIELEFTDRPGVRTTLLRDQLDAADWRRLGLAIRERR